MAFAPAETLSNEILDVLASSPSAEQLVNYQPPIALQQRRSELLEKNRASGLRDVEPTELDELVRINRFMSRLKLKACKRLSACVSPTYVLSFTSCPTRVQCSPTSRPISR